MTKQKKEGPLRLSPSALGDFMGCPRKFWWEKKMGIKIPRGAFPSLPGGMDAKIKDYFDQHRALGTVPDELKDLAAAGLRLYQDPEGKLQEWRNNFKGISIEIHGVVFRGAIDDLLIDEEGCVAALDNKTRGAPPKPGQSEVYYGTQIDSYHLLFRNGLGLDVLPQGHLLYWWPQQTMGGGRTVFERAVVSLDAEPDRAADTILRAKACLEGDEPAACAEGRFTKTCDTCKFFDTINLTPEPAAEGSTE